MGLESVSASEDVIGDLLEQSKKCVVLRALVAQREYIYSIQDGIHGPWPGCTQALKNY